MSFSPARLSNDEWTWRWQYAEIDNYEFLHRIAEPFTVGDKNGWESSTGRAVCGVRGVFEMPGVVSRLGRSSLYCLLRSARNSFGRWCSIQFGRPIMERTVTYNWDADLEDLHPIPNPSPYQDEDNGEGENEDDTDRS